MRIFPQARNNFVFHIFKPTVLTVMLQCWWLGSVVAVCRCLWRYVLWLNGAS